MLADQRNLQYLLAEFIPRADQPTAAERLEKLQEVVALFVGAVKQRRRFPDDPQYGLLAVYALQWLRRQRIPMQRIRLLERHAEIYQTQISTLTYAVSNAE